MLICINYLKIDKNVYNQDDRKKSHYITPDFLFLTLIKVMIEYLKTNGQGLIRNSKANF